MDGSVITPDEAQRRVVGHDGGPLLVLGGPGTGKTAALVERWVRLATETTEPHRVLLLVPTRERALVLRDELPWRLAQPAIVEAPVHTWHALAYHLVTRYYRKLGYPQPPIRLTTAEQWTVVRDLLAAEKPSDWQDYGEHLTSDAFVGEVADFCVRAGYRGLGDDDLRDLAERRPEHAAVASFAVRYREHLRSSAILDYPELILSAARLLDEDEGINEAVRRRFTHVLVDDAQELAPAQLLLLRHLCLDHLVCAGDPDSAIEAFRGADPHWLDRFVEIAPSHERVVLDTAHRFGKPIGDVARALIAHAPEDGAHRPSTFGPHDGSAEVRCYATMAGELEATARELRSAHLVDGIPYDRMAVLLAQPGTYGHTLERVLEDFDVPYRIASADRALGAEPAVRAVLDVCRLALLGDTDDGLCKAVLSSPIVGLGPYQVRDLEREAYLEKKSLIEVARSRTDGSELAELHELLEAGAARPDETADATFARVFDNSAWCRDLAEKRRTDQEAAHHLDALTALGRALAHFGERRPGGTMLQYLEGSIEASFAADTWTPGQNRSGVDILSFHRSKGLDWDLVCVLGVAEGQIPKAHRAQGLFDPWALEAGNAQDRALAQLAEERRTLYVALTRARRRLVVSCSPGVRKATPSRFLTEAFGTLPEPVVLDDEGPPVTLAEASARLRRTLAHDDATDSDKAAAAAALARIDGADPAMWWWRREWTAGAPLYPEDKLTTSFSRIGKYDDCPLRFVLESVLGLDPQSTYQMKFGSLVHRILEDSDPVHGHITSLEEALAVYRKEFEEHHKDYPNRPFAVTYWKYGRESIIRWWRTERTVGETVAVEYAFDDLDFDGHTIRGRIDRVAKTQAGLVLSDYKTSRSAAAWDDARESLQLAIYYLAAKTYPALTQHGEPHSMQLVYPGIEHTDRMDGSTRCDRRYQKPEEAEVALARLGDLLERAAAEEFAPSPEADCQWCRMRPLCPRWPEGRECPR